MKKKPKVSLSPLQQKRLARISILLALFVIVWLVFAPKRGLFFQKRERVRLEAMRQEIEQMNKDNNRLKDEIEGLENNNAYLEKVAREQHGMLKKNEQLFDFSAKKRNNSSGSSKSLPPDE